MPVTYKDFDKDVKDLLTKNYQNGSWKVESKLKGPKDTIYVNPVVERGVISADVQYDFSSYPLKSKVSIDQNGKLKDKLTATLDFGVVEVTGETVVGGADCCQKWNAEVTHEFNNRDVNVKTAVTTGRNQAINASVGAVYEINRNVQAGVGVGLNNFALHDWSVAARYVSGAIFLGAVYTSKGAVTVSAKYPLAVLDRNVVLAAQVSQGKTLSYTIGGETGCLLCKDASVRFKVTPGVGYGFAWVKRFSNAWKAAVSFEFAGTECKPKVGVLFTLE